MDLSAAAAFFDNQPVYDAYTGDLLFMGQPDLYDASERDSPTGWRRSISAAAVTIPARGCMILGSQKFIAGRIVEDFFDGEVLRQHLIAHPADGLMSLGAASTFLSAGTPTSLYAALSWIKDRKEESTTSTAYAVYDFYCHESESLVVGQILQNAVGEYFRVEGVSIRSGGLRTGLAYSLGASALRSVSYTVLGTEYDPESDSSTAEAPILINAFVESFYTNYHYLTNAADKFERADVVFTILASDVDDPQPGDTVTDATTVYNVISAQAAGSAWLVHGRPV